jgi:hypothetical protein
MAEELAKSQKWDLAHGVCSFWVRDVKVETGRNVDCPQDVPYCCKTNGKRKRP